MSENAAAAPPACRSQALLVLGLLLVATGLLVVDQRAANALPVAASHAVDKAHRWTGYRIPRNGHADGGWMGGYKVGGTPIFVVTPTRHPNRRGYEAAHAVADLDKSRGASRRSTARAAWVLSKYGGYKDAVQAAAVDAVVYHLLAGGRWRIGQPRGAARIQHSGDPATVLRFARIMLEQSRNFAGRYRVTVTATSADVGGTIQATVKVTGGHHRPAAGLPVAISAPGAATVHAVSGDDGRAVAILPATQQGWQDVTASVGEVPEHRLYLRGPVKRGQAAAAEGGVRRTVDASALTAVRGPQKMTFQATPENLVVGGQAAVTAAIAGDGSPRPANAALYGPFSSATAAVCSGSSVGTTTTTVTGDGSYLLPALTPSAGGFYAWQVTVDGTATNLPVTACGAVTKVRARATTTLLSQAAATVGDNVPVQVTVAGLPFPDTVNGSVTLFGPYASDAARQADQCGTIAAPPQSFVRTQGNGTFYSPTVPVTESGYYAWRVSINPGDLWLGSSSPCLAAGTLMSVP
jgi:hypothetical protein